MAQASTCRLLCLVKFDAMSWPAAAYQKYAAACVPHRTSFTDGRHAELDLDLFISFSLAEVEYNPDLCDFTRSIRERGW